MARRRDSYRPQSSIEGPHCLRWIPGRAGWWCRITRVFILGLTHHHSTWSSLLSYRPHFLAAANPTCQPISRSIRTTIRDSLLTSPPPSIRTPASPNNSLPRLPRLPQHSITSASAHLIRVACVSRLRGSSPSTATRSTRDSNLVDNSHSTSPSTFNLQHHNVQGRRISKRQWQREAYRRQATGA